MDWQKKGLIFKADNNYTWMISHAQVPFVEKNGENRLRIYFGTRDLQNHTTTTFIEVEAQNPSNVLYIHDRPVLSLGKLGCFDDSGAMPSWVVNYNGKKYLYYIGWNIGITVPYHNSIGLAVSEDGGLTFNRLYDGPILDRIPLEPHLCATPCIFIENGFWRMWYLSGVEWKIHAGRPEPYYHIKYAESMDGIYWKREGHVCIDFNKSGEGGIARPSVLKDGKIYRMWYSYRGGADYRTNLAQSYRIGYAESSDGLVWARKDDQVGINVSKTGWDSEMVEYPFVLNINDRKGMFYNGNGFGKSGIGYAILDE
jgi:hypothetical protein